MRDPGHIAPGHGKSLKNQISNNRYRRISDVGTETLGRNETGLAKAMDHFHSSPIA
jgi:hypothetical protein